MQPFISTGVGSILVIHYIAPHSGVKYPSSWKSFMGLVLSCERTSEDSKKPSALWDNKGEDIWMHY